MSDIVERVDYLERWRDGNGKPGAAAILAEHEKRIYREETRNDVQDKALEDVRLHHATEESAMLSAFEKAMAKRGRSVEGVIRAFGPYAAAIAMVVVALIGDK